LKTSGIIFRCYRDYHPLRFFGAIALVMMTAAFALGGFLMLHYLSNGSFTPHKWAGFTSGALLILALLVLLMGIIGDMLNRHRIYLEELLYHRRVQALPPTTGGPQVRTGGSGAPGRIARSSMPSFPSACR
jgi:hypothetical protein